MTTSPPSAPPTSPEGSMSSPRAFRARTSATPDLARGLMALGLDYGSKSPDWFASLHLTGEDLVSSSWKTSQRSLVGEWESFSETWPRSGSMRSGTAYQRRPVAPLTGATGLGLLPTPEASNTKASAMRSNGRSPRNFMLPTPRAAGMDAMGADLSKSLVRAQQVWPTPAAMDTGLTTDLDRIEARRQKAKATGINGNGFGLSLGEAVRLYPTPAARDFRSPNATPYSERGGGKKGEQLPNAVGGALNPTWVEWLMGFPLGWTACMVLATRSSLTSRTLSAKRSPKPLP